MRTLRILKLIHNVGNTINNTSEYIIEQKTFWGWREVKRTELSSTRISFKTYEEAESYMFDKYTGHGMMTVSGNVYYYEPYTYLPM